MLFSCIHQSDTTQLRTHTLIHDTCIWPTKAFTLFALVVIEQLEVGIEKVVESARVSFGQLGRLARNVLLLAP